MIDDLSSNEPILPSIIGLEGISDPATKKFAMAVKEILEVRLGTRPRSSLLDKGLTFRDLYTYDLGGFVVNGQVVRNPAPNGSIVPSNPNTPVEALPELDLTPPGAPLGFLATGTKLAVLLEWNEPATNVAYAEVYRASVDNIGLSILIGTTEASIYADIIGATDVTNYYWIRFVSINNIAGAYNAIAGTLAVTGKIGSADLISVDGAKIIDATILNAKIANVSADKITTGTIAVGQAIQVGTAANRIFIDGNGIIRTGGMLDYLNGSGFFLRAIAGSAQFGFGNGTTYIGFNGTDLAIQTPNLQLNNNSLTFNGSGTFAGDLVAVNGTLANLRINAGGAINSGAFTGYAWPSINGTGFHLGTEGLLLGNANNNRYVQFTKNGEFYMGNGTTNMQSDANGFIVNGPLIATGNILNNAITNTASAYTENQITQNIAPGATSIEPTIQQVTLSTDGGIICITCSAILAQSGGFQNGHQMRLYRNNVLIISSYPFDSSGAEQFNLFLTDSPPSGIYTYSLKAFFSVTPGPGSVCTFGRATLILHEAKK